MQASTLVVLEMALVHGMIRSEAVEFSGVEAVEGGLAGT